jgi:hypothetical protein
MKPGSSDQPSWTFSLAQTTVRVKPEVLLNLAALWAALIWLTGRRYPEWSRGMRRLAGLLDMVALVRKGALAVAAGAATAGIVAVRRRRWFHALAFLAVALLGLGGSAEEVH